MSSLRGAAAERHPAVERHRPFGTAAAGADAHGRSGAGDEIALMLSSKRTRPAEAAPRAEEIPRKMKAAAQTYFTAL